MLMSQVAEDLKRLVLQIVNSEPARNLSAISCHILTVTRMLYSLTPLTSIGGRATAVKPHSGGLTNLPTGPTLQTWIVLAAFVDTVVNSVAKTPAML